MNTRTIFVRATIGGGGTAIVDHSSHGGRVFFPPAGAAISSDGKHITFVTPIAWLAVILLGFAHDLPGERTDEKMRSTQEFHGGM